jgi:hypothetical protein
LLAAIFGGHLVKVGFGTSRNTIAIADTFNSECVARVASGVFNFEEFVANYLCGSGRYSNSSDFLVVLEFILCRGS